MGHRQEGSVQNRPFGLPWLDSCYQESLLPDAPWHQVREKMCSALAQKMGEHMDNEQRRQMMFELLGHQFQMKYFPDIENDPQILEPPKTTPEDRQKIQLDTNNWLQVAVHDASLELKCQRPNIVQDEQALTEATKFDMFSVRAWHPAVNHGYRYLAEDVAPEMEDFLHHTKSIVAKGMERHLFLQEEVLVKKKKLKMDAIEKLQEDREMWNKYQLASKRKHDASHIKGILKNPPMAGPTPINADGDEIFKPPPTAQIKADLYVPDTQPPLWGYQADTLGRALVAILKRDPRRFGEITWRLHGRQLPGPLRSYIWLDVLLLASREDHKGTEVNVEKIVREKFGKLVSRGMEEMRVTRATHSPISSLIDKAAIEIYDTTPSMKAYLVDNNHMKDTSKALNVIYCYDRSYAPYLIYWLFPFQLAFKEQSGEREHAYELALYLHLLEKSCFPKWPEVFSLAERVLDSLRVADEELLLHLKEISNVTPNIDTKNFMVELIHRERSKAEQLKKNQPQTDTDQQDSARLFTDPLIYIRKWIGEGFVSVLDTPAVLWLWDQLFMEKWERKLIVDVCFALLLLLRHKFMEATDHETMAEVFYREPCKLYTKDVQRAWMHLQYGGDPEEVPLFNRRKPSASQVALPVLWERKRFPLWYKPSGVVQADKPPVPLPKSREAPKAQSLGENTPKEINPKTFQDDLEKVAVIEKDVPKKVKDTRAKEDKIWWLYLSLHEYTLPKRMPVFNHRPKPKPILKQPSLDKIVRYQDAKHNGTPPNRPLKPEGALDPVGVKGVVVYLVFDKLISQKERWVASFDPEDVKILCTVYYGSTRLTTEVSTKPAKCPLNARQLDDGSTAYKIYFLKLALEFPKLDPSQLDVEEELGAHPFAVIQVDYYGHEDTKAGRALPITLGWARLQLYAHSSVTGRTQTWTVDARDEEVRLRPGGVPDTIPADDKEPVAVVKPVYIQADSKLRASVYDMLLNPPPSPTPTLLKKPVQKKTQEIKPPLETCSRKSSPKTVLEVKSTRPSTKPVQPKIKAPTIVPVVLVPAPVLKLEQEPVSEPELEPEPVPEPEPEPEPLPEPEPEPKQMTEPEPVPMPVTLFEPESDLVTVQDPEPRVETLAKSPDIETPKSGAELTPQTTPAKMITPNEMQDSGPSIEKPATPPSEAAKPNTSSAFDVYIDLVDNIPDNATFVKITGRLVKTGELSGVPDLLVLPEMDSTSRSPSFTYRLTINKEKLEADRDMVALLRVYTIDRHATDPQKKICVIGSCLFHFYDQNGDLRVGSHRRILRTGMPDLTKGVGVLNPHGLDEGPRVPGCTMYIRLLPASKKSIDPPSNLEDYKFFEEELNDSEGRVVASYLIDPRNPEKWPNTEKEMVKFVQDNEKFTGKTSDRVWVKERLDHKKHLPTNQPAENLPVPLMVEYRMPVGIKVQIMRAHGLKSGRFIQCYTRLVPGALSRDLEPTEEGYGQVEPLLTHKHDFEAAQKDPIWKDDPTLLRPHPDPNSVLVVQIFGFEVVYKSEKDHDRPGKVTNKKGAPLSLYEDAILGWAFVPLMNRDCVWSGEWHVPILTTRPDALLFNDLSESPIDQVFQNRQFAPDNFLDGASLDIRIWDAHFAPEELPQGFKDQELLLEILGSKERCALARQDTTGKPLNQIVLASLGKKFQKLGTQSPVYEREEEFFSQVMDQTLSDLLFDATQDTESG